MCKIKQTLSSWCLQIFPPLNIQVNSFVYLCFQERWTAAFPLDISHYPSYSSKLSCCLGAERTGPRSCRLPGPVLKPLPHRWSGLSDTHSDHGDERDQSLRRTRLNGDCGRLANHCAKRQTQNLGGESAKDEKWDTRKGNVGWEIWLSSLLCRIRHWTRECLEISLFVWKKRRR